MGRGYVGAISTHDKALLHTAHTLRNLDSHGTWLPVWVVVVVVVVVVVGGG